MLRSNGECPGKRPSPGVRQGRGSRGSDAGTREALAYAVLQDVGERPGDLALVQFALTETWRHRNEHKGDLLRAYVALGRVEAALRARAVART